MSIDLARILKSSGIAKGKVLGALEDIEKSMMKTRQDLGILSTNVADSSIEGKGKALPQAVDELDAVIESTEEATNKILEAAEVIEKLASWTDASTAEDLKKEVTRIYEACNFQDLAGQRIAKVIKSFKDIEQKIHAIVQEMSQDATLNTKKFDYIMTVDGNTQSSLMVGPQRVDKAIQQQDIDQLFKK